MTTQSFINNTIPPLQVTDNVAKALERMNRFHVQHLPMVVGQEYRNLVEEYDIWEQKKHRKTIGELPIAADLPFVNDEAPMQEVMKVLIKNRLSLIPVLDNQHHYIGVITLENVLAHFARANALYEPGGILVLEIPAHQYSLAEIAHAIEGNNARILNTYTTTNSDESIVELTIKVNHTDLTHILATLERYGYRVKATYCETNDYYQEAQENFDALMNYLRI